VHRVSRDKHQVSGLDSPCLFADAKAALTPQDEDDLVVVGLYVKDVRALRQNVDVAGQVLTVE